MPALDNPRHERLAQELASGKHSSNAKAYIASGYDCNENAAGASVARLLDKAKEIRDRIAELQEAVSERKKITLEKLIDYAEEARIFARETGSASAMVAAVKELGILSGKRVERQEVGEPGEFTAMSTEDLAASILDDIAVFGPTLPVSANGKTQH